MTAPKVTKTDILNATDGMLQKQLYAVFTSPIDGLGPVMESLEPHLKFLIEQEKIGTLMCAGPFWADDEETWNGEGMVIFRASSLQEARDLAAADPMHSSGARSFTIRPWLLNEGTFGVSLNFSTGKYTVA